MPDSNHCRRSGSSCHFVTTTVTSASYELKDSLDTGLYPTTATVLHAYGSYSLARNRMPSSG